jgi:glyoxylase-like metal-dependent hydrolase (beta-lactamase superfamily II)
MNIERLVTGPVSVNTYVLWTREDGDCIVIDPGGYTPALAAFLKQHRLRPAYILLTHGHFDHIGGVYRLKELFGATVMIHADDAVMLTSAKENLSGLAGVSIVMPPADQTLTDGAVVEADGVRLTVMHTPGHSPGGVCLVGEGVVFSGDTLFWESVGRTDFPSSRPEALTKSLQEKVMALPDDTVVYPGHGPETTIGHERRNNPFLKRAPGGDPYL